MFVVASIVVIIIQVALVAMMLKEVDPGRSCRLGCGREAPPQSCYYYYADD